MRNNITAKPGTRAKKISYPNTRIVGKPMESNTQPITTKLSSNLKKDIDAYCHEHGISQSEFIRIAAKTFLHEQA